MKKDELLDRLLKIATSINYDAKDEKHWKKEESVNLDFSTLKIQSNREVSLLSKFIYKAFYHNEASCGGDEDTPQMSNEYWKIAKPYVTAEVEEKWLLQKIYFGGFVQIRKGLISYITWAFEPDNPTKPLKKFDFVKKYPHQKYQIVGNVGHDRFYGKYSPDDEDCMVRFYWNIKSDATTNKPWILTSFLDKILKVFNQRKIIFSVKLNNKCFEIPDNIVLYIDKRCFLNAMVVLPELDALLDPIKEDSVPDFTHKISKGFGFAEEPVNFQVNPSFGESRSWEIAYFLLYKFNKKDIKKAFEQYLLDRNFDIEHFYLNPNSTFVFKDPQLSAFPKIEPIVKFVDDSFLEMSANIGFNLCNTALWIDDKKCTWALMQERNNYRHLSTCDFSISNGTAGIALYLFRLFYYKPDELFYKTAKGALIHATSQCKDTTNISSLYEGKSGILLVIVQIIELLQEFGDSVKDDIAEFRKILIELSKDLKLPDGQVDFTIKTGLAGYQIVRNYINKYDINLLVNPNLESILINKLNEGNDIRLIIDIIYSIISIKLNDGEVLPNEFKQDVALPQAKYLAVEDLIALAFTHWQNIVVFRKKLAKFEKFYDPKDTLLHNLLNEILHNLALFKKNETKNYNYKNIIGLLDFLLNLKNQASDKEISPFFNSFDFEELNIIVKMWAEKINESFLKHDQFPPFDYGFEFHNPGLVDGVAGLGYFYLRLYDSERVPSPWALDFCTKNIPDS